LSKSQFVRISTNVFSSHLESRDAYANARGRRLAFKPSLALWRAFSSHGAAAHAGTSISLTNSDELQVRVASRNYRSQTMQDTNIVLAYLLRRASSLCSIAIPMPADGTFCIVFEL